MILGITGSMGSGKSTAAAFMEELGYRRFDSDQVVRDEILHEPEVVAAVSERWGREVLDADGRIDRRRLAAIVFRDEAARADLEDVVHPRVYARWRAAFTTAAGADWAVEVPLLFEKRLENWFDFTICVASSSGLQLARLEKRGITHALAEERISKQLPLALKLELADFVLWNDGPPEFLRAQLVHLHAWLTTAAGR